MERSDRLDFGFSSRAPDADDGLAFQILRVGPGKKFSGVILSEQLVCRRTHWWGGRTTPCHEHGCPACAENSEGRWHGWLACYCPKSQVTAIVELTARALKPVQDWADEFGSLRAAELTLSRVGKKLNGRLFASLARGPVAADLLPADPNVQLCLLKMWGLEPGLPALGVAVTRLHKLNGAGGGQ